MKEYVIWLFEDNENVLYGKFMLDEKEAEAIRNIMRLFETVSYSNMFGIEQDLGDEKNKEIIDYFNNSQERFKMLDIVKKYNVSDVYVNILLEKENTINIASKNIGFCFN